MHDTVQHILVLHTLHRSSSSVQLYLIGSGGAKSVGEVPKVQKMVECHTLHFMKEKGVVPRSLACHAVKLLTAIAIAGAEKEVVQQT